MSRRQGVAAAAAADRVIQPEARLRLSHTTQLRVILLGYLAAVRFLSAFRIIPSSSSAPRPQRLPVESYRGIRAGSRAHGDMYQHGPPSESYLTVTVNRLGVIQ